MTMNNKDKLKAGSVVWVQVKKGRYYDFSYNGLGIIIIVNFNFEQRPAFVYFGGQSSNKAIYRWLELSEIKDIW
jgi:hypothetical protein